MNEALSIKWQKYYGTYQRNNGIKLLYRSGMGFSELGRLYGLSRQRIEQIVKGK